MRIATAHADVDDRTEELRELADEHPELFGEFLRRFELSWIYHENALEGIVVTHAELSTALKGRPIAPDTYLAIRNLKLAIQQTRERAAAGAGTTIDFAFVEHLHDVLGTHEPQFESGKYRKFIPLHRTYFHDIAQPASIGPRMTRLIEWAAANRPEEEDVIKFAAHFHHEFMSIFPYPRHTGKVGRLLVNLVLLSHGYLPVIFHASERQGYYETLKHSSRDLEKFLTQMIINCVENAKKFIHHELEEREKEAFRSKMRVNAR